MNTQKLTNYRWVICVMLFFATTVNYLDRQVLSLTFEDFIKPEFHWTDSSYGTITGIFSIVYALAMLFAGRFVDWMDTKKGFLWAIGVWSVGACMHAFSGIVTAGITTGTWVLSFDGAKELIQGVGNVGTVVNISVTIFVICRCVLALGEAGNFPAAIKATAEYFPKKDRAYATSIFNSGASVGALVAPLTIPLLASAMGWEMAFIVIGGLGFIWMGFWIFVYKKPEKNPSVNKAELEYILSDKDSVTQATDQSGKEKKLSFFDCFKYKQTWAFALGKFMTDGVWWFYLFWAPSYLKAQFDISLDINKGGYLGVALIFTLYAITMLSIYGGKIPSIIIKKTGKDPYAARMQAMLIFAFIPLVVLAAQPLAMYFEPILGQNAAWFPVILIGLGGAAHQSWSANIFSTVGDMFPKSAIATITGIGGMAGGLGSLLINKSSGNLFDFAEATGMTFLGFEGKPAGYFIIFIICAVAYLIGWTIMKSLVPKYKPVVVE
ncbi:MAG: MFS transporter [Paludibacter sp.]|jgi:ACS family hexuronate transporter-like MFS transporter|nr:MFS transporter [Paludibacter sp.]